MTSTIHVPVVNIPRKDLPLRTEVIFVFRWLGLDIFRSLHFGVTWWPLVPKCANEPTWATDSASPLH